MVDREHLESGLLALGAAVLAYVLFARGHLGPTWEWWRLYAAAVGLFVALRVVEWGTRRIVVG
ncbi:MAG: hypothetical protein V5A23_01585 [Halobacteriales archaeon]